jgi:hypothetical protein
VPGTARRRLIKPAHPCLPSLGEWPLVIRLSYDFEPVLQCDHWVGRDSGAGWAVTARRCETELRCSSLRDLREALVEHVTLFRHVPVPEPWSWY